MATNRKQDNAANPPQKQSDGTYASRSHRISKEDLYILLALFMEDFPLETKKGRPTKHEREEKKYRKVGAALVLPNNKIFAIDCTRNGVHGVARLLMEHQDVVKDCKIFVSRKPCSFCTKLLVQSKVKEIFYLPIEPEYHQDGQETEEKKKAFENEKLRVDELFRVSAISQKVFVPGAGLKEVKNKYDIPLEKQQKSTQKLLMEKYWKGEWLKNVRDNLPWPSFDSKMEDAINADFRDIIDWAAKIALVPKSTKIECKFQRVPGGGATTDQVTFNPHGSSNVTDKKQAAAFITLARFLAEQTDDPKRGVGAVIIQGNRKNRKVGGLGWNGFPSKAVYGQFPRASDDDEWMQDKKYPYIIHAEQNALLMRNTKSITDGILFVTKTPCSECTPLLEMQGIKTVVLGTNLEKENKKSLGYQKFSDKVKEGTFNCFEMKKGW